MTAPRFQAVRGERALDIAGHRADFSDILIEDDVIREIGAPGMAVPDGAEEIDARRRLIMPGLMDALPDSLRKRVEQVAAAPYEESLAASRAMIHGWSQDRGLVRPALAPTIPLHCSDEFITACRDLATEADVGLHMHLAESKIQVMSGITRFGRRI